MIKQQITDYFSNFAFNGYRNGYVHVYFWLVNASRNAPKYCKCLFYRMGNELYCRTAIAIANCRPNFTVKAANVAKIFRQQNINKNMIIKLSSVSLIMLFFTILHIFQLSFFKSHLFPNSSYSSLVTILLFLSKKIQL